MRYRPEIDGLRAVAVVSVVLSHAGLPAVQGGFVGVDVFFVISGFLITSLMIEDHNRGAFRLSDFYYRRARRILPALFLVIFVSLPFAWWLMLPVQFSEFGESVTAAALFLSNVYFMGKTGYFETDSDLLPFLHVWSLAVEEQFYLLFPLFFLITFLLIPRRIPFALTILIFLSLSLSEWGARNLPEQNFFFTFSRFWEILLGALCASLPQPGPRPWHRWLSLAGLALIGVAIFGFNNSTATPSLITLVPVSGAALILVFGAQGGAAFRILTLPAMTAIGMISYSLYLWHQPVFAFGRLYFVTGIPAHAMAVLLLIVLALSYLSWRFVEQPFRRRAAFTKTKVFSFSGTGIAVLALCGVLIEITELSKYRYAPEEYLLLTYEGHYRDLMKDSGSGTDWGQCIEDDDGKLPDYAYCMEDRRGPLVFWGDSHARELARSAIAMGLVPALGLNDGCPPIVGIDIARSDDCRFSNDEVFDRLGRGETARHIVLHADWILYLDGNRATFETDAGFADALGRTIASVKTTYPQSKITVVGGVPQWGDGLPLYLYRLGLGLMSEARLPNPDSERIRSVNALIKTVASDTGASFLDPFDILCNADGCLAMVEINGASYPTAYDYGHLTVEGAKPIVRQLLD